MVCVQGGDCFPRETRASLGNLLQDNDFPTGISSGFPYSLGRNHVLRGLCFSVGGKAHRSHRCRLLHRCRDLSVRQRCGGLRHAGGVDGVASLVPLSPLSIPHALELGWMRLLTETSPPPFLPTQIWKY